MKSLLMKFCAIALVAGIGIANTPTYAQDTTAPEVNRDATGGAQTLDDILKRQSGEAVPLDQGQAGPMAAPEGLPGALATRGGASDSSLWRALRQGQDVFTSSSRDPNATTLVQDDGEQWLATRSGPVLKYTGWAIGGMVILLALFFTLRGRIKVDGGLSGTKVRRFSFLERFAHWLLAISFITLAISGFSVLAGREALIPFLDWANALINGQPTFDEVAGKQVWTGEGADPSYGSGVFTSYIVPWLGLAKPLHNSVSWAFMIGLVMIFVLWVFHNIPGWTDVKWLAKGGGFIGKGHPDAKKFNAGQKIIFWSVILLGIGVSASGVMLLFPYQVPLVGETFETINVVAETVGRPTALETELSLMQEQQYASLWHAVIAAAMTVIVLAHIYIGSIGMQGAFAAMGSGKVDLNWAKEHHNLWVEKMRQKGELFDHDEREANARPVDHGSTTPAE